MKFACFGDVHYLVDKPEGRKDNTGATISVKLMEAITRANLMGVRAILQPGDLTDVPRSWRILYQLMSLLKLSHGPFLCVRGQHDSYMDNKEANAQTISGILASAGRLQILGERPLRFEEKPGTFVDVYGASWGEAIPQAMESTTGKLTNILVLHRSIGMKNLWFGQEGMEYAPKFLNEHPEFSLVVCGDIHQKFRYTEDDGRTICNAGPMLRREAKESMFEHKPGFYIYDSVDKKLTWLEIPHLPADEVLSREHIKREEEKNEMLESFIRAVEKGSETDALTFKENLLWLIEREAVSTGVKQAVSSIMGDEA